MIGDAVKEETDMRTWSDLPDYLRIPEVRPYFDKLKQKEASLAVKRCFDLLASLFLLLVLSPVMLILAVMIKADSPGGIFYRQERVTQYGRIFQIHKFRTMVSNADQIGSQVTVNDDQRITRIGKVIRRVRLDELPQLFDILVGNMTFVGTRPEVKKYVRAYRPEMRATLLLPAGVTSKASICYKDEDRLLSATDHPDRIYVERVLPGKMKYNLESIRHFSLLAEVKILFETLGAVLEH